eukprot:CAMPEP_0204295572 /NCGR_PEP_ID=MMETSP0468-20130131/69919_1 /ASSEMBLY_ACC=CAM_ASM_000383 /TAXON_ID=2969 /ORGANISM="Oxyrrhis marina" /LENGTH=71 /DNA_ID=CAMNT_0051274207 /DNA_START=175 /DNA_END=391 /DNA_ORIENTATION=+
MNRLPPAHTVYGEARKLGARRDSDAQKAAVGRHTRAWVIANWAQADGRTRPAEMRWASAVKDWPSMIESSA